MFRNPRLRKTIAMPVATAATRQLATSPLAVVLGVLPLDTSHWVVRCGCVGVIPVPAGARYHGLADSSLDAQLVLRIGYLSAVDPESIKVHAMFG